MGIVVIMISSSDNDKLSSPPIFFLYAGSEDANIMKLWRKVGSGKNKNKKRPRWHASKRRSGTNFPKIVKYKSPSRSKLNNLTG